MNTWYKSTVSLLLAMRVNGEAVEVAVPPHWTLLEVLRYRLDLIGSKQGCDKGDCGACTVQIDGRPVLSCITLGAHAAGREVTTVEGLTQPGLHPLHDCFDRHVAAQCGFCTSGMIMNAYAMLQSDKKPSRSAIIEKMDDNLCRCGAHQRIVAAIEEASK